MSAEIKRIEGKACVSTALLCEWFGISRQAANEWEKKGCPKMARGYWCMGDVIAWKTDQSSVGDPQKSVDALPLTAQKIYWETRCREAQAESQNFKNAVIRGDYLEKKQMEQEIITFFVVLKQAVLSLPRKAAITATKYITSQRARVLEAELLEVVSDALTQWSRGNCRVDTLCNADSAPPGADNPQPVGGQKANPRRKKQQ